MAKKGISLKLKGPKPAPKKVGSLKASAKAARSLGSKGKRGF